MTDLEVRLSDPQPSEDVVHVVCCDDYSTSFCGLDMEGEQMTTSDTSCVVCADLEKVWHCPLRGRCKWILGT